ncbi:(deoxy)nucleoside triphosphate pyrophosphohydrolase [Trichlorobacter ammonificans]|uniref:8-oxo-dGTP diphosphatase n=1 Tax=Trichlorobacter ammonificans TaxID=2916410 RepID=A0ABM9D8Z5_9BACT|nr:(deoxy)nucleoside triphosphate pyrophosphohydrolase [Trichlorobacter ammonificans]CAH2031683.1 Mutator mutT protein (7,8-dihydro-8-oxoguanine-triphosphatase) [Trichlorobacter ammonificans]
MTGKHLRVACAIIERNGLVLATRRSAAMSLPLKWEFPGGKIDHGETAEQCLLRELVEELSLRVVIRHPLPEHTHAYPDFSVTLYPFVCGMVGGEPVLHEHAALAWLPPGELLTLDWAEADLPVINGYLARCGIMEARR